jgi:hypothetical protein
MAINRPNARKIYQHLPLQDPPKCTQIRIFGLKIYHLATLYPPSRKKLSAHVYICEQGCQMVCFQTKNSNLGKFWRVLQWKMLVLFNGLLVHFTAFCYILWTFGTVCGNLVYIFPFRYFAARKIWQPCT